MGRPCNSKNSGQPARDAMADFEDRLRKVFKRIPIRSLALGLFSDKSPALWPNFPLNWSKPMKKQRAKPGEILSDILSLVGFNIPREEIMTWTKSQRKSAEKWAALCHLKASDNPVKVPKMPEHLEKYPIT